MRRAIRRLPLSAGPLRHPAAEAMPAPFEPPADVAEAQARQRYVREGEV
jgi:hypothetical protein